MKTDPLIVVREELQPPNGGRWFATKQEPGAKPYFTTRDTAKIFFGRGILWLQLLITEYRDEIDHLDIQIVPGKGRRLQLRQIEEIAHILYRYGKLDHNTFLNAIAIIRGMAGNYGLLIGE